MKKRETNFVILSHVENAMTNETFVFPSDEDGEILNWRELEGSTYGKALHSTVLFNLGDFFID
jgi:hypothetical protein